MAYFAREGLKNNKKVYLCSPHLQRGGHIDFDEDLVGIHVGINWLDTFLSAQYLNYEPVVGFLPNFHGYIIWT